MKRIKLAHYFIPHPETHAKAKFLSWHYLLIYILLFMFLRVGIDLFSIYKPGVLGINSSITVSQIIDGVNKERQQRGLSPLKENQALSQATLAKAKNMFEENYWAHFSPSGRDPWSFIQKAGYKFTYAGENLARNFYTSPDVIQAWMNSPSHRENILNPKYQDIGIAVVEGVLQGQKTTLIVQMFGTSYEAVAAAPNSNLKGENITNDVLNTSQGNPLVIAQTQNSAGEVTVDPFALLRIVGISVVAFIALLLLIDFMVLKRRGVFRPSSHHFAHLSFLAIVGASLLLSKIGEIL